MNITKIKQALKECELTRDYLEIFVQEFEEVQNEIEEYFLINEPLNEDEIVEFFAPLEEQDLEEFYKDLYDELNEVKEV